MAVGGIKVIEDVVAKESGPVDEAILWFFRNHVPDALDGFFEVVTLSGSARFLVPLSALAAVALLVVRRRVEALLVAASVVSATLVVWGMKAIVGRARPALWEAQWSRPGAGRWRLLGCGQAWSPHPVSSSVSTGRRKCWRPYAWVPSSPC